MASYLSGNVFIGKKMIAGKATVSFAPKTMASTASKLTSSVINKMASAASSSPYANVIAARKPVLKLLPGIAAIVASAKPFSIMSFSALANKTALSPFIKTIASVRPPVSLPMVEQIQPAVTAAPSIPLPAAAPTVEEVQPVVTAAPSIASVPMTKFQLFLKTYFGL